MSDTNERNEGPSEGRHELELEATGDGSFTLRDRTIGQSYGSGRGARSEALHVFVHGSGAAERLAAGRPTRVLEVGLGTGLNLLVTADAAAAAGTTLHYRALETRLPPVHLLARLGYEHLLRHPEIAHAWITLCRSLEGADPPADWVPPVHALARGVTLEVAFADARDEGTTIEPGWAHAIYHDAFSPDVAPGLWSEPFLDRLARGLAPGGVLTTYSVKGEVRRRLQALGLHVAKRPGPPGGKREMLRAVRPGLSPRERDSGPTA